MTSTMSTTTSKVFRAFSIRDKSRTVKKSHGSDNSLFALDEGMKKASKDELQKIQEISLHFSRLGNNAVPERRIEYALRSKAANGDVKEAIRLLLLYEDSLAGVLRRYDPTIKMLGAENRERQSCWLDSLLFAMFAKTDVFESVLHQQYEEEETQNLVTALRLWVNMLRAGRLITVDITTKIQNCIAECGWTDAAKLRQQDVSEAFNFVTDTLRLPLLTLKTDIFHPGKEDANDDHKFITERMLECAIPGDDEVPPGSVVTLEQCMENYFNNRVEVKRHLARVNTLRSSKSNESLDDEKSGASHVETREIKDPTNEDQACDDDEITKRVTTSSQNLRPTHMRSRATSVFSERRLSDVKENSADGKEKDASGRREVLMDAWQFLNLIPWYTDNVPEGRDQVRSHFSRKRLMLGICLKRYGMTNNGTSFRKSTFVDIPLEMSSPHFADDQISGTGESTQNFKLVLKSFVCHRGHSVEAGHYISFVRAETPRTDQHEALSNASDRRPRDTSDDAWLKFDDLAGERVSRVDIHKILKEESPYLLFYRVQPIDEGKEAEETPPPYQESEHSLDYVDQKLSSLDPESRASVEQSARPSIEITTPVEMRGRPSMSLREDSKQASSPTDSSARGQSSRGVSPAIISRSATKSIRSSSARPQSDDSSKRFSMNMSKLAARMSRDKLNSPDIIVNEVATDDVVPVVNEPVEIPLSKNEISLSKNEIPLSKNEIPLSKKEKKKKFKGLSKSRRGSNGNNLDKPDRECIIM